ncbi:LORF2 protein, partial [Crocuta crocuta]
MKRCSTSCIIKEMQIKTMEHHHTPIRMTKIWNTDNTKYWQIYETAGTPIHFHQEYKMGQPFWKTIWWSLTKLNTLLPYDPVIGLFGIYPKGLKTYVYTKTC